MQKRLLIRIAGPLLLFVAAGTAGMVFLLNAACQRVSHSELVALAKANADFIRDTNDAEDEEDAEPVPAKSHADSVRDAHLAQSEFLSEYLGQLLGVEVRFQRRAAPDARHEEIAIPIDAGGQLTLIRELPPWREVLLRPISVCALAAFWGLCLALAWALALPAIKAQRFATLGAMATSLAHEIRNPVAAIRLHGQLLEQAPHASAGLIVHEAARIEDLVNQWMFLARPEPPRKTEVALAEVLDKTVQVLAPAADHAKVHITVEASPPRRVQADSHRLGQVFHNLILNAIQAMPAGGSLSISVSANDISFADTGHGFSAKALRRGAQAMYSEKEGGMGLGLSVASKIIRAHGGRIILGNQPAGGAIVRVIL
jgi:signal transduction histidine kinase